jgi:hypothetical protein
MTAGHFAFAAAVKPMAPNVPLWALMVATYLLDIVFIVLVSAGIESFSALDPGHPSYGGAVIGAYYDHSLLGALVISAIAGAIAWWAWNRLAGLVIGGVVFSHWVLDLIVHRPDMPLLPGNAGELPLMGLGLWNVPVASALVELILVIVGTWLYYRAASGAPEVGGDSGRAPRKAVVAAGVTGGLILVLLIADVLTWPLGVTLALMLAVIVVSGLLDARLGWRARGAATA